MPNVFVSYSRRDFHAAEALTSVLAASGRVSTWLDVEHLRPGTDWEIAINAAIDHADALVVVGSPAAVKSQWVTGEWQRALRNGTPVHVALVHDTELPPELTSVHDLRGSFFAEARRLVGVIWGQVEPRPRRRFPLSRQMALLWAVLLFCTVTAGVGATLGWDIGQVLQPVHAGLARIGFAAALANVLVAGGLIYLMVRLFRRTVSPSWLREGLAASCLSVVLSVVGTLIVGGRSYLAAAGPDPRTDSAWLYLAAGAAAVFGAVLVARSRTIHLEMPTGLGYDHIRGRFKGHRVSKRRMRRFAHMWALYRPKIDALKQVTGVGSAATYWVWCHPEDKPIANVIAGTCEAAGFAKDEGDPRWAFVVVSTRTPAEVIRNAREVFGDRAVFVLATSLHLAEDDAELRRYQWLDFREQQPEELYEFLRTAVTGMPGERGMVTVPTGVDTFRAPRYITNYLRFGRMMIGTAAAPPLGLILAGDFVRAVPVVLVTLLLAASVMNLMRRTADRTVTAGGWLIRTVVAFLLFIGWLVLAPNIQHIPPVNRVGFAVIVVWQLFGSTKAMLALWLPPEEGQKVLLASPPVTPPGYAFGVSLFSLVLATGYIFLTQA
ncbi:toll/interleukin-1 receptor domain-containing protein [Lentzea sp. PSKA42]|uniref:Toll/interleukin-1 receptor domain-containing protein n=1 Tax=Lentzea indica TaxID=2604800 RepID=A0ABX1FF15_9PSEU|nr:toll/interleukin-1 receptor domain-containing protein [Lentzea indica]NKE57349.1 toll/interleukin-1 receptor domain-containing protein [Lentzea indica]